MIPKKPFLNRKCGITAVMLIFFLCITMIQPVFAGDNSTVTINHDMSDAMKTVKAIDLSLSFDLKHSGLDYPLNEKINFVSVNGWESNKYGIVVTNNGIIKSKPTILSFFYGNGTHTTCANEPFCWSKILPLKNVSIGEISPGNPEIIYTELIVPTSEYKDQGVIIVVVPADSVSNESNEKIAWEDLNVTFNMMAKIPDKAPYVVYPDKNILKKI